MAVRTLTKRMLGLKTILYKAFAAILSRRVVVAEGRAPRTHCTTHGAMGL